MMKKLGQLAEITEQAALTKLSQLTSRRAHLEGEIAEIMRAMADGTNQHMQVSGGIYEKWVAWGDRRLGELQQKIQELQPVITAARGEAQIALGRTNVIDKLRSKQKQRTEMRAVIRREQAE
jgi:hypothetical protein